MADFSKILDKAKELEQKMKDSQDKIKSIRAEGISGSSSVKVTLSGDGEMLKVEISNEIMNEEKSMIEDLIVAAHNNAKEKLKIKTSVSSFKTVNLMTDKLQMFEYLNRHDVDVGSWKKVDNFNDAFNALNFFGYPSRKVVIKPRFGSGSRGIIIVNHKKNSFTHLLKDRFCGEGSWEVVKEELKNSSKSLVVFAIMIEREFFVDQNAEIQLS